MTEKPAAIAARRQAVFLPAEGASDLHIVDELIRERCPSFVSHWSWPLTRPLLYSLLGYDNARAMADHLQTLNGRQSFDFLAEKLQFRMQVEHIDRLPASGRCIVVANHPTGLADGVAVWEAIRKVRTDVVFFANADAIRVNPRFSDQVIPVEWVMEKRSPAKTRETLRQAGEAFAEEKCVVIFPSGKLARMIEGQLTEQDWFPTAVSLARKKNAPVIPLHLDARNSKLFYFFSRVNGELRDITLFHELLNKKGSRFDMGFGPEIPAEALQGDAGEVTDRLRDYVAYELGGDLDRAFENVSAPRET
ncbi:MAG: acyltransferase [Alphaproteobacteria bacterium]|jgi:putative hemolysin|nr:acyltransferase [Alphaproteobacteria bacterium]